MIRTNDLKWAIQLRGFTPRGRQRLSSDAGWTICQNLTQYMPACTAETEEQGLGGGQAVEMEDFEHISGRV